MRVKLNIFLLVLFFAIMLPAHLAFSDVTNFPYANFVMSFPGVDTPFPGLGQDHAALSDGIRTVTWNPAGLAKIKVSESYLGITSVPPLSPIDKAYSVKDLNINMTGIGTTLASNYTNSFLFTGDPNATVPATREFNTPAIYNQASSGMDFKQGIKVFDWLALGITSKGDTNMSTNISGSFGSQYLSKIDLTNTSNFMNSGISVNQDGKMTYTYNPGAGGSSYTYTSEASVWSGFLRQTQRVPFSIISDSRNNLNIRSNLMFTGAGKWQNLSFGFNFMPIAATLNVDNTAKAIVNAETPDMYFYAPNFDPANQSDAIQWINDPNRYGTTAGYTKKYIRIPEGQSIGEAKYTGFYDASAIQTDLGFMYDIGPSFTIGAALENISGASVNFKGVGRVAYVNSRVNTAEPTSIIDPSATTVWSPFSDTFTTLPGTENIGMLPDMNFALPQKTRIGLAFKRPILVTLDYETLNNTIVIRSTDSNNQPIDIKVTNIRIVKGGGETQLFSLPIWLRGNASILIKPQVEGLSGSSLDTFNKLFVLFNRAMPLSADLGLGTNAWGYKIDTAVGVDGSVLLGIVENDPNKLNINKISYGILSVDKDNWHASYQASVDPAASAAAYNKLTQAQKDGGEWMKAVRLVSTLTIGYKF